MDSDGMAEESSGRAADFAATAFPRLGDRPCATREPAEGEVLLQIHQRRAKRQNCFEMQMTPEGNPEIPMSVCATTVGSFVPKDALLRSRWLVRCLNIPEGQIMMRSVAGDDEEIKDNDDDTIVNGALLTCRRVAQSVMEIGLPSHGAGHWFLSPRGILQCLDYCAPDAPLLDAAAISATQVFTLFMWATVLELSSLVEACREVILNTIDATTVALTLAAAHATNDEGLLHRCYWCLRGAMCGVGGVPPSWLDGKSPSRLVRGTLSYKASCQTPLCVLASVMSADLALKREKWLTPKDSYTLCQVHRLKDPSGSYPHTYEMRLDHTNEIVMTAIREDEQSACRIFERSAAGTNRSEHCEEFLGAVVPNFWGTLFSLYDSGADLNTLIRRVPEAKDLPLRERTTLCKIGYETNILGDCPRKITVDFERGSTRYHMENVAPRWDKKLNSYALPFFGRVKKASAKNFQLVVDNDPNTIFLMFGKISKDVFCLDYRGPLAPLDAMAIAIAALAKKRAVS